MSRHSNSGVGCLGFVVVGLLIIAFGFIYLASSRDVSCTVESVDRVASSSGSGSDARVYTKECGVLENTDSWVFFKFNSADVQAKLVPGTKLNMEVAGWRIPIFSMFPNVIEVK